MQQLGDVAQLAHLLVEADRRVEQAEAELAVRKENARRLREESLPSAMEELGLTKLTLDDGSQIETGQEVYCSIKVDDREAAYRWLDEHGFGGLIKTEVSVPFGRDPDEQARLRFLCGLLRDHKVQFQQDQSVHAGTLKAWLKEQLRDGRSVPLQLFGARPVTIAKVKLPKGK